MLKEEFEKELCINNTGINQNLKNPNKLYLRNFSIRLDSQKTAYNFNVFSNESLDDGI